MPRKSRSAPTRAIPAAPAPHGPSALVDTRVIEEKQASEDRHASTQAYIEYMRPRCVVHWLAHGYLMHQMPARMLCG
jgi:hypothetical protein